jgi:pimeloyl-ACP methyl ester carboxylesterase
VVSHPPPYQCEGSLADPARSYAELFTTAPFTHMIFVDQAPLQNSDSDGWDSRYCSRGMHAPSTLGELQATLRLAPESVYNSTTASCLAYRSHPRPTDNVSASTAEADESFFLATALKGNPIWYGKLMADHTALDWRDSIRATFGNHDNETKVLVIASSRSGCFPPEGPLTVVDLINADHDTNRAKGVVVDWGGHWCYWESPQEFNKLVLAFIDE